MTHELRASLLETMVRQQPVALLANVICTGIVVGALWGALPHAWMLLWLALAGVVTLARYLAMRHHVRRPPRPERTAQWTRNVTLGAAASGMLLGVAGLVFFVPEMPVLQVFLSFVIGGLCAGAAVALAGHPPAFYSFLLPSLSPLVIRLLLEGERIQFFMALMLAVFSGAMMLISRNLYGSTVDILVSQNEAHRRVRAREAELAHVGRLSTMGELASTLAHELNQPLSAVVNYSKGCLRRVRGSDIPVVTELLEPLEQISAQANRASEMISHVGSFVGKSEERTTGVDVNKVIRGVHDLVKPELDGHRMKARYDLGDGLPALDINIIGIEQVVLNLRNAIESCKDVDGPEITIETRLGADGMVIVGVADQGRGLPQGGSAQCFEPFFTTRDKGMGMGLPISRSIVEAHGGTLWATDNHARGATFFFSLPPQVALENTSRDRTPGRPEH